MPSHGPTEPPEDNAWDDEYDKMMESDEGKAMLDGLGRTENLYDGVDRAATPVETDDDALQAFVKMVYDRGIAHGHWLVADEAGHAALAEELAVVEANQNGDVFPASTFADIATYTNHKNKDEKPFVIALDERGVVGGGKMNMAGLRRGTLGTTLLLSDIEMGVIESFEPSRQPAMTRVFEIGSARSYFIIPGRQRGVAGTVKELHVATTSGCTCGDPDCKVVG